MSQAPTQIKKQKQADFSLHEQDPHDVQIGVVHVLRLIGDWRATTIDGLSGRLKLSLKNVKQISLDTSGLIDLDTAGAYLISTSIYGRLIGEPQLSEPRFERLFSMVGEAVEAVEDEHKRLTKVQQKRPFFIIRALSSLGRNIITSIQGLVEQSVFIGNVVTTGLISLTHPRRIRWTALFSQMQATGLDAIPVISISSLFVGAVIAFLGVLQLRQFGASIYAIDMLGMAVLREFGPVIAAVMLAGRSSSSFAAELGAMKMRQEVDAMRVLGIDPINALVLPRLIAMMIMTPLVTFVGSMMGLLGGSLIIWSLLGYSPDYFLQRINDNVGFVHFFVGMFKTPFFAAMIAIIGCHAGLTVKEDVISLGKQVTKAVVHAILAIILLNAIFALLFNDFEFK